MGLYYEIEGAIEVRDSPAARDLLKDVEDCMCADMEMKVTETGPGIFELFLSGAQDCAYRTAINLEAALVAFGTHVTEVGCFAVSPDGNGADLWIGPQADIDKAVRAKLVQAARDALSELTKEERRQVCRSCGRRRRRSRKRNASAPTQGPRIPRKEQNTEL